MATGGRTQLRKMAREFITMHRTGVMATTDNEGKPHVAIVYCIAGEDLSIYFTTRADGRKFDNLMSNPALAMMFSSHGSLQQLQLSGKVERLAGEEEGLDWLHELMKLRFEDQTMPRPRVDILKPGVRKEYAIFRVIPTEMTYADFETSVVGRYKPDFKTII